METKKKKKKDKKLVRCNKKKIFFVALTNFALKKGMWKNAVSMTDEKLTISFSPINVINIIFSRSVTV